MFSILTKINKKEKTMKDLFFAHNSKTDESNLVDLEEVTRIKLIKEKAVFYLKNGTQFEVDDTYFYILSNPEAFEQEQVAPINPENGSTKVVEV
jgi:hypothetical protein